MELTKLRNVIVKLLHEHTKRPVVMLRQAQDKPFKQDESGVDYPFIAYNLISTLTKDKEMGNLIQEEIKSSNQNFKTDILETLQLQPQFTISFSVYGKDSMQAKDLVLEVWNYFKHKSYYDLIRHNIVVVECMNISNRDVLQIDEYERREGFDVRFRTTHQIQRTIETIETYKINKKG